MVVNVCDNSVDFYSQWQQHRGPRGKGKVTSWMEDKWPHTNTIINLSIWFLLVFLTVPSHFLSYRYISSLDDVQLSTVQKDFKREIKHTAFKKQLLLTISNIQIETFQKEIKSRSSDISITSDLQEVQSWHLIISLVYYYFIFFQIQDKGCANQLDRNVITFCNANQIPSNITSVLLKGSLSQAEYLVQH